MSLKEQERRLWTCRWNWCAQAFDHAPDLLDHLKKEHFSRILRVEKQDWDVYLRANEGCSGMTDSLLQAIPTQSTASADSSIPIAKAQSEREIFVHDHTNPAQPTEVSELEDDLASPFAQKPAPGSARESPSRGPPKDLRSPLPNSSHHFADYDAASSPITTPFASPLPPTPPLHARVADAINSAASKNVSALPLPRRKHVQPSPSPTPRHALPLPRRTGRVPAPASSQGSSVFGTSHSVNASADSSTSIQEVETQLTEGMAGSMLSQPGARAGSPLKQSVVQSQSSPVDPYPHPRTQARYDTQAYSNTDGDVAERRFSSGNMVISPGPPSSPPSQSPSRAQPPPTHSRLTSQFSSGTLVLRPDSEPPDAMDVDEGFWAPLRPRTQAAYPSQ
ncbi:uncharacterized protein C8Q71DRAFT_190244 [Rhodofomes roseus]|uniref:C2H2-type domain-containing protein n=1 Tax=Rhodofomes roseus TaxID=34475 RepID=A0ABQ8K8H8_9APHY|nr:uncharacterized protein C8Q71DRAFT_190244 [Rhodofomes roseus]KAH9833597.1 hypothetical protein C8Q71DRAFT_190244 [Rhodofomes roseus]